MSGFEIVGLIAGIIPLIELAIRHGNEFKNSQQAPRSYRDVATRLPLVQDVLVSVKTQAEQLQGDGLKTGYKSILPVLDDCKIKAEELNTILKSAVSMPGASAFNRAEVAVRRMRNEPRLKEIMNELLQAIQLIAGHRTLSGVSESQIAMLSRTVKEMAAEPPQVHGDLFLNLGTGAQFVNTGDGAQNNNFGGGSQINAKTFG